MITVVCVCECGALVHIVDIQVHVHDVQHTRWPLDGSQCARVGCMREVGSPSCFHESQNMPSRVASTVAHSERLAQALACGMGWSRVASTVAHSERLARAIACGMGLATEVHECRELHCLVHKQ
jgi:hypothetical protein